MKYKQNNNMKETIKEILKCQEKLWQLTQTLNNENYWINKAKEAGFIPQEGDWISVKVSTWRIEVYVYHKEGCKGAKYWLNGKWFDTSFPKEYPTRTDFFNKYFK